MNAKGTMATLLGYDTEVDLRKDLCFVVLHFMRQFTIMLRIAYKPCALQFCVHWCYVPNGLYAVLTLTALILLCFLLKLNGFRIIWAF